MQCAEKNVYQEVQPNSQVVLAKQQTDCIVEEAGILNGCYTGIILNILRVLKQMKESGKIDLKQLAKIINESCGIEQYTLTGNETVDDVWIPITQNTNCFFPNIDLLYVIDGAFCRRQFRDDIRSYSIELRNFLSSTTIETFKEKVMSQYENWNSSEKSGKLIISIEVGHYYSSKAMIYLNQLNIITFGEKCSSKMVLKCIRSSVLTITYSMPMELFLPVLSAIVAKEKIELLKMVGILSIKIGDVLVHIGDEITEDEDDDLSLRVSDMELIKSSKYNYWQLE